MKRPRRRRLETEPTLIITSMVDMFTLLLTFLLNFVAPSDAGADALVLPTSTAEADVGAGPVLDIGAGEVRVNGARVGPLDDAGRVTPETARAAADALSAAPPSEGPLLVRCDRAVPYRTLAALLTEAARVGRDRYELVVIGAGEGP